MANKKPTDPNHEKVSAQNTTLWDDTERRD